MSTAALIAKIQDDVKTAMRNKDKLRLTTLRMALADVKKREIDEKITFTEEQAVALIEKLIKQRRDAAQQYDEAGRDELAQKERDEIVILSEYLPEQLNESDLIAMINDAMAATGAQNMKDMGKVMGILKPRVQGRCDFAEVSQKVKALLSA